MRFWGQAWLESWNLKWVKLIFSITWKNACKQIAFGTPVCLRSQLNVLPIAAKADIFVTGDFMYHQFFDADGKLVIADVGHFESEQFTIELLADFLIEKFPTFAVLKTETNTNPIAYI